MKEVKDRIRDRRPSGNVRFAGAFLVLFAFWVVLLSILKLGNQPEAENIDKIDADNRKMEGMHDYDASYMEGAASPQEKWLLRSAVAQAENADFVHKTERCRAAVTVIARRLQGAVEIRDKSAVEWRKLAEELLQTAFEAQESEEAEVNVENALELVKERYAEAASFGERCKRIYIAAINDAEELRQEATEEKAAAEGLVKEKKAALEALQAKMRRIREPDSAVTPTNDADVLAVLRKSEGDFAETESRKQAELEHAAQRVAAARRVIEQASARDQRLRSLVAQLETSIALAESAMAEAMSKGAGRVKALGIVPPDGERFSPARTAPGGFSIGPPQGSQRQLSETSPHRLGSAMGMPRGSPLTGMGMRRF